MKRTQLTGVQDVSRPEYFEDTFPRHDFPRFAWAGRPTTLPHEVWTTETTHRDGQQGGVPLSVEHGIAIYDILCDFTGSSGAIRQAEFFVYRGEDRATLEGALERYRGGAPIEPTTWIRASRDDVELIHTLGVCETGMLASASDYHTFHKFNPGGRSKAAQKYLDAVHQVLDAGIRPRIHLEDATRASLEFMLPLVEEALTLSEDYDPQLKPKFRVCDTLGLGLPYDHIELPRSVPKLIRALRASGLEPEDLEFHPHNDSWMVVPNSLAALQEGCAAVNGTSLGKGERSGNAPLEAVLFHLIGMGYFGENKPDFTVLNDLADLYAVLGHPLPASYPLYGRDAHRTRAGIHADGLNKFWWMYAPFNVPELLGRRLEVSLTRDSGVAGLIFLIRQHLGLELTKEHPVVLELHGWLVEQFAQGRVTAIEWEELEVRVISLLAQYEDASEVAAAK